MSIKALTNVTELAGYKVVQMDKLRDEFPEKFNQSGAMDWLWFENEVRPYAFIYVREDKHSLSFTLQEGDATQNGVTVPAIIEAAWLLLMDPYIKANVPIPGEIQRAATHLTMALKHLKPITEADLMGGITP